MTKQLSATDTLAWAQEMAQAISHTIRTHAEFAKTPENTIRFHDNRTPYAVHPIWCACTVLMEPSLPEETRRIGYQTLLWHDLLEDTTLSLPDGTDERVRALVNEMTFHSFAEEMKELWTRSDTAKLLKLYDKVSNLFDGTWMKYEKWNRYVRHTAKLADEVNTKFGDLNIIKFARVFSVHGNDGF
jgi:hypothetical protein